MIALIDRLAFVPASNQVASNQTVSTVETLTVTDTVGHAVTDTTALTISAVIGATAALRFENAPASVPATGPHVLDNAARAAARLTDIAPIAADRVPSSALDTARVAVPSIHAPSTALAALHCVDVWNSGLVMAAR